MKNTKKFLSYFLFAIIILSVSLIIGSCGNPAEKINEYTYINSEFKIDGQYYYETKKTITDNAEYDFQKTISSNERNRFVTYAEQLYKPR